MIGLDTNVVIRYLAQDDPKQAKLASQFIEKKIKAGEILWICQITLCEVVWVLERCYKLSKNELIQVITQLLQTEQLQVEKDDIAWSALRDFSEGEALDFSDCLIGRQNHAQGCTATYTFDKKAAQHLNPFFLILH
jgi:predicted nucleic-acid-binding protein